jgi:hypothetical protein
VRAIALVVGFQLSAKEEKKIQERRNNLEHLDDHLPEDVPEAWKWVIIKRAGMMLPENSAQTVKTQKGLLCLTDQTFDSFVGWVDADLTPADFVFLVRAIIKASIVCESNRIFLFFCFFSSLKFTQKHHKTFELHSSSSVPFKCRAFYPQSSSS